MLTSTFCHICGIGEETERRLWSTGITSWEEALRQRSFRPSWAPFIQESMCHFEKRNAGYFAANLPSSQHWRLYWDFRDSCAFVDIETIGAWSIQDDEITTLVLYDGRSIRWYVKGQNLDQFIQDVEDYRLLVTYNGKSFDIPRIEKQFHVRLSQAHIDLRYPLRSLGLQGGLKGCEQQLGIARPGLENVDGFFAILLWKEYRRRKDPKVLETLLAYNIHDTLSLHALMVHAHNQKLSATPFFASYALPAPSLPKAPLQADWNVVERIRFNTPAWERGNDSDRT